MYIICKNNVFCRYTHYSITDDDTGPDNDATNRRVAMDFLREMKERKANNEANPPDTENVIYACTLYSNIITKIGAVI